MAVVDICWMIHIKKEEKIRHRRRTSPSWQRTWTTLAPSPFPCSSPAPSCLVIALLVVWSDQQPESCTSFTSQEPPTYSTFPVHPHDEGLEETVLSRCPVHCLLPGIVLRRRHPSSRPTLLTPRPLLPGPRWRARQSGVPSPWSRRL